MHLMRSALVLAFGLVVITPVSASGQRLEARFTAARQAIRPVPLTASMRPLIPADTTIGEPDTERMLLGGALGGVIGLGFGAVLGVMASCDGLGGGGEWCGLAAFPGALIGESLLMAGGTHLANDGRGSLLLGTAATALVGAAGLGAAIWSGESPVSLPLLLFTPIVQLLTAVEVEKATTSTAAPAPPAPAAPAAPRP